MKHPEYQVFVEKVGNNINMKDYGNFGEDKRLKRNIGKANITAATKDSHFTVLGFTSGTGAPIMCAIKFAANDLTPEQQLSVDIRSDMVADDFSLHGNHGKGKNYPGGPIYSFRSKEVTAFICCSPKGGITSMLLSMMLERMDSLDLFPCIPGVPRLFLILDGHGSRLQVTFLR